MNKEKEFTHLFRNLFSMYLDELRDRLEPITVAAAIDFTSKRISKDAHELLYVFHEINDKYFNVDFKLLRAYNELQDARKKEIVRKEIVSFKKEVTRTLRVINVKAQVVLERIEDHSIEFEHIDKLKKLDKLAYNDVEKSWANAEPIL